MFQYGTGKIHLDDTEGAEYWYIDTSTVGQYTGLSDKNGIWIFEGDILRNKKHGVYGLPFEVVFRDGGFQWRHYGRGDYLDADLAKNCEVIGNIHDNPELLETEEGGLTKR